MARSRKLTALIRRAEELGIADQLADMLAPLVEGAERAERACESFRWGDACDAGHVVQLPPPPPVLWQLGPLVAVTYEATKRGELAHWEHDFGKRQPVLAFSEDSGRLYIVGGDYKVTHRGIVG
jgi:hypothetical protein